MPKIEQLEDCILFSLLGLTLELPVMTYNSGGTIEYDAARPGTHQSGDGPHRCCLAASGRTEKRQQFAAADLQIE